MSLEEDIKQSKPFGSLSEKAGVNLLYTTSWLNTRLMNHFKTFDLTSKQFNILRILKGAKKPVSLNYIRKRMLDPMSDLSRILTRMEKKDLITKEGCDSDNRLVDIRLNKNGLQVLARVTKNLTVMKDSFQNLNDKELATLNKLLDKIRSF